VARPYSGEPSLCVIHVCVPAAANMQRNENLHPAHQIGFLSVNSDARRGVFSTRRLARSDRSGVATRPLGDKLLSGRSKRRDTYSARVPRRPSRIASRPVELIRHTARFLLVYPPTAMGGGTEYRLRAADCSEALPLLFAFDFRIRLR
jgi:hypothetical protein